MYFNTIELNKEVILSSLKIGMNVLIYFFTINTVALF